MSERIEMKITYVDPDQRALFVAELPDGGFTAWSQKDKAAPRKLVSKGYIKPEGYVTFDEAQEALGLHVSNHKDGSAWARWDVLVNGKRVSWDDYHAMCRGEMPVPEPLAPAAVVTLANIEYRIASHMHAACENLLQVGRCLNEAKEAELVPHGEWEAWVRRNACMSERQAQKLMQAARSVLPGSAMERLPISKIQAILSLPEPEREEMAEKAADEGMSLRKLQEAVRAKQEAEATAKDLEKRLEASKRDAQAYLTAKRNLERTERDLRENLERTERNLRDSLNYRSMDIEQLKVELEKAKSEAPATGISAEAQAEIDRLRAELSEAEDYAEQQAELRQKAQREMLAAQSDIARGDGAAAPNAMTALDLAAAVRSFIGTVGVLPHMGVELSQYSEADRQQMRQHIDMVATWISGARQALDVIVVDE